MNIVRKRKQWSRNKRKRGRRTYTQCQTIDSEGFLVRTSGKIVHNECHQIHSTRRPYTYLLRTQFIIVHWR